MPAEFVQQRRIGLAIIGILAVGILLVLVTQLATAAAAAEITATAVGLVVALLLLFAYWSGWTYARHITVVFFTLLAIFTLPEPYVSGEVSFGALIPAVLALILVSPIWVVGSAIAVLIGLMWRAGFGGIYAEPITIVLYCMIVGGMILARLVTDATQRAAERQTIRAEEALANVETQATELGEANQLMNMQLDQQKQLLDLVATLETPVVPLAAGMLFAPIVGHVDSRRAQHLTSRLLQEASSQRARMVVLDIAGVPMIDTAVAKALLNTARSLRLLGCEVTLSGISATVAITLTSLGVDLNEVNTVRSPQEALAQYLALQTEAGSNGHSSRHI